MKKVRNFIYNYEDGTVVVANIGYKSQLASQIKVNDTLENITTQTGYYRDMKYHGHSYVGIEFKAIPEKQLIAALS